MSTKLIDNMYDYLSPVLEHKCFNLVSGWVTVLNPIALSPQLFSVIVEEDVGAISIPMWVMFTLIQLVFTLVGIKTRNTMMFWNMLASIGISIAIVVTVAIKT